jgi:phosphate uptake regulator
LAAHLRKVLKLGRSTLAVSLPRDWVDAVKLKQGDYLVIEDIDSGSLKLAAKKREVEEAERVWVINADLCEAPNMLSRMVIGAYLVGHKRIWIQSKTRLKPEHIRELDKITSSLVGLLISEQTDRLFVLQSLADPSNPTMDDSIRRLHRISSSMREAVVEAFIGKNADTLTKAVVMGKEGDRVYWLAVRQLLSATMDRKLAQALGIKSPFWLLGDRAVLSNLKSIVNCTEKMARESAKLLERCFRLEGNIVNEISRLDDAITDVSEDAVSALITRDVATANQAIESVKRLEEEANRITDRLSEAIQEPLCRSSVLKIVFGLREILSRQNTIAEIAINRALEEPGEYLGIDAGFTKA